MPRAGSSQSDAGLGNRGDSGEAVGLVAPWGKKALAFIHLSVSSMLTAGPLKWSGGEDRMEQEDCLAGSGI